METTGKFWSALQETPKVRKALGMNLSMDVVVYNLPHELSAQTFIRKQRVSVERRSSFNTVLAFSLVRSFLTGSGGPKCEPCRRVRECTSGVLSLSLAPVMRSACFPARMLRALPPMKVSSASTSSESVSSIDP